MYSEAIRREAMERARTTGRPALSGKVELVQEITTDKQAGFLLYLPLYSIDRKQDTENEQHDTLIGFVYSAFRAEDLMTGILQERFPSISFQVYDGDQVVESELLYDSQKERSLKPEQKAPRFTLTNIVNVSGRPWTIVYSSTKSFSSLEGLSFSWVLLAAGILFSCLISIVSWMLISARQSVRMRTEELYKQETINTLLLEELTEAVVVCDADQNLTRLNKKAREWHGSDLHSQSSEKWSKFFSLYEEDGVTPLITERIPLVRAFNGEVVHDFIMCVIGERQELRYVLASSGPLIDRKGNKLGAFALMRDITELKQSQDRITKLNEELEERVNRRTESLKKTNQELILAKEEAESSNLAKSSFLASMSHEIRTPMNGVVGMVEILMNERLTKKQKDSICIIRDSAFSLLRIIDDILDFSKIEAGHIELENVPTSVSDIVENVVSNIIPVALKVDVYLSLFIAPNIPAGVLADPTRLRQIITNLIGNAVKFSGRQIDRQGRVDIRITVKQEEPLLLQFDVIDNGIGMTPATVDNIFESFVQADSMTTRRFGGTGLGLAICKRLVELMQGEISVDSEKGCGSTFSVILPFEVATVVEDKNYEDIMGVNCIVIPADYFHAEDLKVYLENAGAIVYEESDSYGAAQKALTLSGPVVVLQENIDMHEEKLDVIFDVDADVRHVMLTLGRRKRPRVESVNTVTIDAGGLRRADLIEAVAIASGKASPEAMKNIAKEGAHQRQLKSLPNEELQTHGTPILVLEDDKFNIKVIRWQLSLLGYTAEFAENGEIALEKWRSKKYRLLLTDLRMLEMDDYTLAETIREEESEYERLPIVALIVNDSPDELARVKALGIDEYLTKPIELGLLKRTLAIYVKQSSDTLDETT